MADPRQYDDKAILGMASHPPQTPAERIAEIRSGLEEYRRVTATGALPAWAYDCAFLLEQLTAAEQQLAALVCMVCACHQVRTELRAGDAVCGTCHGLVVQDEAKAQAEATALRQELAKHEEREATCCPEDVGFEEYIASLKADATALRQERDELATGLAKTPTHLNAAYRQVEALEALLAARDAEIRRLREALDEIRYVYIQEQLAREFYYRNEDAGPSFDKRLCATCDNETTQHAPKCPVGRLEAALTSTAPADQEKEST